MIIRKATRVLIVAAAAVALLAALTLPPALATQEVDPAAKDDTPYFLSFDVTPKELKKNRINFVTMTFKFKDEKRNLRGGMLTLNFQFTKSKGDFTIINFTDRVFKRKKGTFEFKFGVLGEKMKKMKIWGWMRDAGGRASASSEEITLTVDKKIDGKRQGYKVGKQAYEFTLLDQNGNEVSLSDFLGKVVLIDFSTMWCGPCKSEAEHNKYLMDTYGSQGFVVLTVLMQDYGSNWTRPDDCKQWAKQYKLTSPVLADPLNGVYYAYTREDPLSVPWNFIIDKNGIIRYRGIGFTNDIGIQIENKIIELLGQ